MSPETDASPARARQMVPVSISAKWREDLAEADDKLAEERAVRPNGRQAFWLHHRLWEKVGLAKASKASEGGDDDCAGGESLPSAAGWLLAFIRSRREAGRKLLVFAHHIAVRPARACPCATCPSRRFMRRPPPIGASAGVRFAVRSSLARVAQREGGPALGLHTCHRVHAHRRARRPTQPAADAHGVRGRAALYHRCGRGRHAHSGAGCGLL